MPSATRYPRRGRSRGAQHRTRLRTRRRTTRSDGGPGDVPGADAAGDHDAGDRITAGRRQERKMACDGPRFDCGIGGGRGPGGGGHRRRTVPDHGTNLAELGLLVRFGGLTRCRPSSQEPARRPNCVGWLTDWARWRQASWPIWWWYVATPGRHRRRGQAGEHPGGDQRRQAGQQSRRLRSSGMSGERDAAERWFLAHGLPAVLRPGALARRVWPRSAPRWPVLRC